MVAGSAAVGLVVALAVVTLAGPWDSGQRTAERLRAASWGQGSGAGHTGDGGAAGPGGLLPVPSAPEVLTALGTAPAAADGSGSGGVRDDGSGDGAVPGGRAPAPSRAALAAALDPLLDDPALGERATASVVDAATGRRLYGAGADRGVVPASTIKIATAVAALSAAGPDHRLATRVMWDGARRRAVLVGGGDPTLTSADLARLADAAAAELERRGARRVPLGYDTSHYTGPVRHPIGPNENLAPVTALMVDAGRLAEGRYGPAPRSADPAADAAGAFADRLRDRGVGTGRPVHVRRAPRGAEELAVHRSAPLSHLVERMLTHSDNDLAEALARLVAVERGLPASFRGAGRAVRAELSELSEASGRGARLPLAGARFADGSGLSRRDRVSAGLLTGLLTLAADSARPELRPVLTGLPVARFSGTLGHRYDTDGARPGAGVVRAKTGTLTGVNTLAGTVVDAEGRLLLFAFTASGTTDRHAAREALDRLAAALAGCGCR